MPVVKGINLVHWRHSSCGGKGSSVLDPTRYDMVSEEKLAEIYVEHDVQPSLTWRKVCFGYCVSRFYKGDDVGP
jgi:hypothetical protein